MSEIFLTVLNMSISASWIVLAVLVLRFLLKKAPKWINVLLWGIVAVRLICPFSVESIASLIPSAETISPRILVETPEINTGISALNNTLNPIIQESAVTVAPEKSINTLQLLILIFSKVWIVGVGVMLVYTAISYSRIKRKIGAAVLLRENIFQSESVVSPFVLGMIKPKIYLPFQINGKDMEHVIAHEKAHIKRKDHLWKPFGFVLLTIHWFNPLMWLGYVLLCRDIELACDEKVVKELNTEQRADYSQALLTCSVNRRMIAACPLAFGEVGVKDRVKSVLHYKKPAFWIIVVAVIVSAVAAVCFLTDPITPEKEEQDGRYYLLIGAEGVASIEVSAPNSSGTCSPADGTTFREGEKVGLEWLDGVTDLRGVIVTALDAEGNILYALSVPAGASDQEVINLVAGDGWLLAPAGVFPSHSQVGGAELTGPVTVTADIAGLRKKFPMYFDLDASEGLDVYIWQMAENSYSCGLLPHKLNENKQEEIWSLHQYSATLDEMRAIVAYHIANGEVSEQDVQIFAISMPHSSYSVTADKRIIDELFWSGFEEQVLYNTLIDNALIDIDNDGKEEWCTLHYGPPAGQFTFIFSAAENGVLEYFNIFASEFMELSFEKAVDGTTTLVGKRGDEAQRFAIGVKNGNIDLGADHTFLWYWGAQGLDSPYAPGAEKKHNTAIKSVLKDAYKNEVPDGFLPFQSYYILNWDVVSGTAAVGKKEHKTEEIFYLVIYHNRYKMENETLLKLTDGYFVPTIITFFVDENGEYTLKDYQTINSPEEADRELSAKFHDALSEEELSEQYGQILIPDSENQARAYFESLQGNN